MYDMLQLGAFCSPDKLKHIGQLKQIGQTLPQIYRTFMTAFSRTSIVIVFEQEQIVREISKE